MEEEASLTTTVATTTEACSPMAARQIKVVEELCSMLYSESIRFDSTLLLLLLLLLLSLDRNSSE